MKVGTVKKIHENITSLILKNTATTYFKNSFYSQIWIERDFLKIILNTPKPNRNRKYIKNIY